ncbi:response regulator [Paenibacillus sp. GCM10027626]|uniref:response regulator n=1 Tax=Paenibacillus sp. GCM10027626 TaxID=3273411 RepID=UPI0036441821
MIGTVLIVDDEAFVRDTLRKMIQTNRLGWTVIAEAANGKEAIALMEEWEPDLVITDVRMPLLDGLELAEWIHHHRERTKVVILTGYRDFEYAQTALRYGALEFLLKPCPEREVCAVLTRLYGQLCEEEHAARIRERWLEDTTFRALFYRLPSDPKVVEQMRPALIGLRLCLVKVDSFFPATRSYGAADMAILQFAVGNIIQELAEGQYDPARIVLLDQQHYALFIGKSKLTGPDSYAVVLPELVTAKIGELLDIPVTARYMGIVDDLEQWPQLLQEFAVVMQQSAAPEEVAPAPPALAFEPNYAKLLEMEGDFMSFIVLGRPELLERHLEERRVKIAQMPPEEARLEALACALTLDAIARKHLEYEGQFINMERELLGLESQGGPGNAAEWLTSILQQFTALLSRWAGRKQVGVIERALSYIEQNYMDRCPLQKVAAHVYLHPNYFSALFKQETGLGYTQYLTQLRLEKAGLLLLHTDARVAEIAREVGYDDPNYFSTLFSKKYQMSPNEYRKRHDGGGASGSILKNSRFT